MDAIVLAAGNSRRFGKNKLLHCLNGKCMYRHILELLSEQQAAKVLGQVIVVSQYEEIFQDVEEHFPEMVCVRNPAPEMGISSSIRLGIRRLLQLSAESDACFFTVADQPYFTERSFRKMSQMQQMYPHQIVAAANNGKPCNPVIFSAFYYQKLQGLTGDVGGKAILWQHMEDVVLCELPPAELRDIDTVSDVNIEFTFLQEDGHVVSLVGAGGKTTLMYALAQAFTRSGKKAIITTTTHIQRPDGYPVAEDHQTLAMLLRTEPVVVVGKDAGHNKLKMPDGLELLEYQKMAELVLIEADGAKRLPCKVPDAGEPVILPGCDIVLGVVGLDALGKPLGEVCFRKLRVMEFLQTDENHCMEPEDLAAILASEYGTRKAVAGREYYAVLNKCDNMSRMDQANKIKMLLAGKGISNVVCTGFLPDKRE